MNTRKALFASKLVLVLLLGCVVIRVVLPLGEIDNGLAPASAQGKGSAQAIESTRLPDLSLEDYAQIAKRDPFGTSSQATGSGKWSLTADSFHFDRSVSEELGLALFGTVSGSPSVTRAIIKDLKTGVFDLYKIGQVVGNARIEGIEADAVILLHDEQRKILAINTWQSNGNDNNNRISSSQTNNDRSKVLKTNLSTEETGNNSQREIGGIEAILKSVVVEPYKMDGQIDGLRITGLEKIKAAKDIGLKNGDVIRMVNGQRLTGKQKAYQVLQKARSQTSVSVELLRENEIKELLFAAI